MCIYLFIQLSGYVRGGRHKNTRKPLIHAQNSPCVESSLSHTHTHEVTAAVPEIKRSGKVNVKSSLCLIMQHAVTALSGAECSVWRTDRSTPRQSLFVHCIENCVCFRDGTNSVKKTRNKKFILTRIMRVLTDNEVSTHYRLS